MFTQKPCTARRIKINLHGPSVYFLLLYKQAMVTDMSLCLSSKGSAKTAHFERISCAFSAHMYDRHQNVLEHGVLTGFAVGKIYIRPSV